MSIEIEEQNEQEEKDEQFHHTSATVQDWLGYLFVEEVQALKALAHGLPANPTVINIGAGGGTSGLAFMESRSDLTLITIDIRDDDSPFGSLYSERVVFESAGYGDELGVRWFQLCGDSKYYAWERQSTIDMVFVDGDHSYDGCRGDIEGWLPRIKPGGIMAVHDYRKGELDWSDNGQRKPYYKEWSGVDRAVDELLLGQYRQILRVESLIAFLV